MSLKLLQLTDFHLFDTAASLYDGFASDESLIAILDFVRAKFDDFDYMIITGDVAHDEKLATYQRVRELLGDWALKCYFIPGNHDNRDHLFNVFPENIVRHKERLNFSISAGNWRLLGLDTQAPGDVYGVLGSDQLDWLNCELSSEPSSPTILFIHHPPVSVGSVWLDKIGMIDGIDFCEAVRKHPQIKGICVGHIHQQFETTIHGIRLMGTPSTSIQFTPETSTAEYDSMPPGLRVFDLGEEAFSTSVMRLTETRSSVLRKGH